MAVYASLLNSIPLPQKQWQTKSDVPSVAAVKVGDITGGRDGAVCVDNGCSSDSKGWLAVFRNYLLAKRLKKLESIPEEKRTPAQQAEIEANKQSFNCMI